VTRFEADTGNYLTQPATQELFKLAVGKAPSVRSAEGSVIVRPRRSSRPTSPRTRTRSTASASSSTHDRQRPGRQLLAALRASTA
jgi:peptidyl-prolyl cis-trans isomerase D